MTKEQLAALYVEWIGYDPFLDDPDGATVEGVAALLRDYASEQYLALPEWLSDGNPSH